MEPWLQTFARANFRRSADTAHDLKTPLNVAVLNLELLRMRLRKLDAGDDEKVGLYTAAIELELRRMGRIFDAFFLLSTPPRGDEPPQPVDIAVLAAEAGITSDTADPAVIDAHDARIRQALKLFHEGAAKLFAVDSLRSSVSRDAQAFHVDITGTPEAEEFELTRIFKFYYTDPQGTPDLSLAVARLIAETYGGELNALADDRGKVSLRLSFPLGAR